MNLTKGLRPSIFFNNHIKLAWVITGLVQSDGSLGMRITKYQDSIRIRLALVIEMTIDSLPLLEQVRAYFGCGTITLNLNRNSCVYTVTSLSELWHIIVPHFLNYPLYGAKYLSFYKFLRVLTLIYPIRGKNSDKLTLAKAVLLGWDINGSSYRKDEELYIILNKLMPSLNLAELHHTDKEMVSKNLLKIESQLDIESSRNILNSFLTLTYLEQNKMQTINLYFILGVIEGDGSFYVGLRENGKIRFGFNITTSSEDIMLLFSIKLVLGCGNVKYKSSSWCRYEVEGNKDLRNTLMLIVKLSPFGYSNEERLIGSKSKNYEIFKKAMEIFLKKGHMGKEGLRQIAQLVYSGSPQKNRKLTLEEYLTKHSLN